MFLYFKKNVNDKYNSKLTYFGGKTYEFDDKRGREILSTLPMLAVEIKDEIAKLNSEQKNSRRNKFDKVNSEAPDETQRNQK